MAGVRLESYTPILEAIKAIMDLLPSCPHCGRKLVEIKMPEEPAATSTTQK